MRAFDLLAKAEQDIRTASQPRYHFEMVLLRWMHLRKLVPLAELMEHRCERRSVQAPAPDCPRHRCRPPQGRLRRAQRPPVAADAAPRLPIARDSSNRTEPDRRTVSARPHRASIAATL